MSFQGDEEITLLNPKTRSTCSDTNSNFKKFLSVEKVDKTISINNRLYFADSIHNDINNKSDINENEENTSFKNNFNFNINKKGFYIRLFICILGFSLIIMNSYSNAFITKEETEGIKDKILNSLKPYTDFLNDNNNIFSKSISISIAVLYDSLVLFGLSVWIFVGKSNRPLYSTALYFLLMLLLQNLFLIESPLISENSGLLTHIQINSFFLNYPLHNYSFYNGHVGFLLIILFEIYVNEFKFIFYLGIFILINLIIYLLALHITNSLCISAALLAAFYFDKISEKYICHKFDFIEIIKFYIIEIYEKISNRSNEIVSKYIKNTQQNFKIENDRYEIFINGDFEEKNESFLNKYKIDIYDDNNKLDNFYYDHYEKEDSKIEIEENYKKHRKSSIQKNQDSSEFLNNKNKFIYSEKNQYFERKSLSKFPKYNLKIENIENEKENVEETLKIVDSKNLMISNKTKNNQKLHYKCHQRK